MQLPTASPEIDDLTFTAARIFAPVSRDLAAVEEELERLSQSDVQVVSHIGEYLRASGGKRVRPALLLLAANAVGGDASAGVVRMAAVMEFLHTATLVHDDIIDNAEVRRGAPSINSRFGNQTAVLMGDWLYMSAFETSLKERSLEILDILTRVTRKMVEGELLQLTFLGSSYVSESEYFDVLERKTAYLFSACCEIGAMLGGADLEVRSALRDYGMHVGCAFQLADDLLDFTATDAALGKPSGVDLLEGKLTLPLIYLIESKPGWRDSVIEVMRAGSYKPISRGELQRAANTCEATERARLRALEYAEAARSSIETLPASRFRDALSSIPTYIIEREN
jgi:octaprenyl-diphosphate synthase